MIVVILKNYILICSFIINNLNLLIKCFASKENNVSLYVSI
ncbi:hypothetical protein HMPREF1076_00410 [Parabacteroides goldsteinii CL02T12C30]|uniref:Uncharacterized protein n=1 Tax=Parabacteroides goldsteinii CL02T12C30 TaxID=999418 RepID=K6AUP2_9BACT|nr:hypothetical protein HMPREF1076_00410 [Parabacteroides goldsteinii CL02T12C30]